VFEWQLHGPETAAKTKEFFELACKWDEDYELSTRISMRVNAAIERLNSFNLPI
jgi:hypothetical protein